LWGYGVDGRLLPTVRFLLFVSMSGEINHNHSMRVLTLTRVCAVTKPLHSPYKLNRQSQASPRGCHCWKLQEQPCTFSNDVVRLALFQHDAFALDPFSAVCDQTGMKTITENAKVLCLSKIPNQCTLQVLRSLAKNNCNPKISKECYVFQVLRLMVLRRSRPLSCLIPPKRLSTNTDGLLFQFCFG